MELTQFVNRDIGGFFHASRTLNGRELLHVIYHSRSPLRDKKAAYKAILTEFRNDRNLASHLRHNIQKIDDAMYATKLATVQGHIFIACSATYILNNNGLIIMELSKEPEYFSSFKKAKQWLDAKRRDGHGYGVPVCFKQCITEYALDANDIITKWWFDELGRVYAFDDIELNVPYRASLPEFEYVHLPGGFAPGEILISRPHNNLRESYTGFVVAPYGSGSSLTKRMKRSDFTDMDVHGMGFDPKSGTVRHNRCELWGLQRFIGKLPESHKLLYDVSRHFKGEKLLSAEAIQKLDPIGYFRWNVGKK